MSEHSTLVYHKYNANSFVVRGATPEEISALKKAIGKEVKGSCMINKRLKPRNGFGDDDRIGLLVPLGDENEKVIQEYCIKVDEEPIPVVPIVAQKLIKLPIKLAEKAAIQLKQIPSAPIKLPSLTRQTTPVKVQAPVESEDKTGSKEQEEEQPEYIDEESEESEEEEEEKPIKKIAVERKRPIKLKKLSKQSSDLNEKEDEEDMMNEPESPIIPDKKDRYKRANSPKKNYSRYESESDYDSRKMKRSPRRTRGSRDYSSDEYSESEDDRRRSYDSFGRSRSGRRSKDPTPTPPRKRKESIPQKRSSRDSRPSRDQIKLSDRRSKRSYSDYSESGSEDVSEGSEDEHIAYSTRLRKDASANSEKREIGDIDIYSDDEDVVSLSRRYRYLARKMKDATEAVNILIVNMKALQQSQSQPQPTSVVETVPQVAQIAQTV